MGWADGIGKLESQLGNLERRSGKIESGASLIDKKRGSAIERVEGVSQPLV